MNYNYDELDKKACEILASRLGDWGMFKGKSIDEIASHIPEYRLLSHADVEKGVVSRNFGALAVIVYDLKTHKKEYNKELAKAKAFHLTRGLPIAEKFLYKILRHKIEGNIGYILLGLKERK